MTWTQTMLTHAINTINVQMVDSTKSVITCYCYCLQGSQGSLYILCLIKSLMFYDCYCRVRGLEKYMY